MTTHDTFEHDLVAAMLEYVADAPTEIDAASYARAVLSAPPEAPRPIALTRTVRRYGWLLLAALVAVSLVAVAVGIGSRQPVVVVPSPSAEGLLAFTREADLWLLPAGATEPVRIAEKVAASGRNTGNARRLYWSPDGRSLAASPQYRSLQYQLGSEELAIGWVPAGAWGWMPDSRSMIQTLNGTPGGGLLAIDPVTIQTRRLSAASVCQPVFSPDGAWIAATREDALVVAATTDFEWFEVGPYAGFDCSRWTGWDAPTWSSDSQRIAFISADNLRAGGTAAEATRVTITVANRDGTGSIVLTEGAAPWAHPLWSPDGEWIAFRKADGLALIRPDGSEEHLIVRGEVDRGRVSWAANSSRIYFGRVLGDDYYGPTELWAYELATREAGRIETGGPVTDFAPAP